MTLILNLMTLRAQEAIREHSKLQGVRLVETNRNPLRLRSLGVDSPVLGLEGEFDRKSFKSADSESRHTRHRWLLNSS